MKIYKSIYGMVAAALLTFTSCSNELPEFSDSDAFVAMLSSTANVGEEEGSIQIPVMLTSLAGLSASVEVTVVDSLTTATEGTDFSITNKTLSFDKENTTQYITVNVVDDDVFTGNKTVVLTLSTNDVNLGANKTCTLTIQDNEHPLLFILGTYTTSVESYFSGRGPWDDHEITIERDNDDVTKVWISNFDPYFAEYGYKAPAYNYFYGFVNDEKTEIRIPCGQETKYNDVCLYGFEDPEADGEILETGNITINIQDDGKTLVIPNAFGVCRSSNLSSGWLNLILGPVTYTKK